MREVYERYTEYRDVLSFEEMVRLFARDDFYHLHFVAQAYLRSILKD